jgi:lipoteichoic acid synthase
MKESFQRLSLLYVAAILIWFKTYMVQKFWFNLPVESLFQEFILLLTPVSSTLILLIFGVKLSRKHYKGAVITVSAVTSLILAVNVIYYRFFNDFITLPVLMQTENASTLSNSLFNLLHTYDILIFFDVLVLIGLAWKMPRLNVQPKRGDFVKIGLAALVIFIINLGMAEAVRPQLLTRSFDRQILVKSIGAYNYHLYDLLLNSKSKSMKVFADSTDLDEVYDYIEQNYKGTKSDYHGIAKGKNVVLVSMESIQSFVIDRELNGQEITPFLNKLKDESLYFKNFYHQTGQGKTSDSEFLLDNALHPLNRGAVFFTHAQNTYDATPEVLKEKGYYSAVFHANDRSFWNRDLMYDALGYDQFFSQEYYTIDENNSVGWGLKDIDFMDQSVELMKTIPQPFYGKLITLTNHYPFTLEAEDEYIPEYTTNSGTVNRYVTTVRYMDESIKLFFERMIEEDLYDNSIFILYGDHYGISANHNKAMEQLLGYPITPYEHVQLQRVPMLIHIPGMKGQNFDTISGQIDMRSTILSLLGITEQGEITFGENMLSKENRAFTVLRDGSYISDDYVYTEGVCYDRLSGVEIELAECEPLIEKAQQELRWSDDIIYGDLLRFKRE